MNTLYTGKYISMYERGGYEFVARNLDDKPNAVVIVALHEPSDNLVLIKEFRKPVGDYIYGLPAGLIDDGETPEEAAIRELFEETGLTFKPDDSKIERVFPCAGLSNEQHVIIGGTCTGELSSNHQEESEDITPLIMSPEELVKIVESGVNINGYVSMLYLMAKLKGI